MVDIPGITQVALTPGTTTNFDVVYDPLGNAITQHVLRSDGNVVGASYPFPVVDNPAVTQLGYLVSNAVSSLTELQAMVGQLVSTASSTAALGTTQDVAWTGTGPSSVIAALKAVATGSGSGGGGATAANQTAGNASVATIASAQGAQGTGLVQPTGGTGILGWLSGIYATLLGGATAANQSTGNTSLAVIAAASSNLATAVAQTTGNNSLSSIVANTTISATAANQTSALTQQTASATALGTPADATWSGSGNSSIVAAMKALWVALTGNPAVHLGTAIPAGANVIGGVTLSGTLPAFAANPTVNTLVPTVTYGGAASASVATTSGVLVTAGAYTKTLTIATLPASTTNIWLRLDGGTAVVGTGFLINKGGGMVTFGNNDRPMPTAAINAITDNASAQVVALAGV